jgi:hypothetical protein
MPKGDGSGPQGLGQRKGMGRGGRKGLVSDSPFQKSTLGGTIFAFAAMLFGNWLDKKFSQKKEKDKSKQIRS